MFFYVVDINYGFNIFLSDKKIFINFYDFNLEGKKVKGIRDIFFVDGSSSYVFVVEVFFVV